MYGLFASSRLAFSTFSFHIFYLLNGILMKLAMHHLFIAPYLLSVGVPYVDVIRFDLVSFLPAGSDIQGFSISTSL